MAFTLAIIGRPNVGKSTLFNRLTGTRKALVANTPGLTRDRKDGFVQLDDLHFTLIDTAGLEMAKKGSIEYLMMAQTEAAMEEADMLVMMLDGRDGITMLDEHFTRMIRKRNRAVVLVVNKCEGKIGDNVLPDAARLGLGNPISISAEHGQGMDELYDAITERVEKLGLDGGPLVENPNDEIVHIAIAGRPNVGKSTLFNALLKEERSIASELAGTTRDAIYVDWQYKNHAIKLVDTAGLRRQSRIEEKAEQLSAQDSYKAIQYANVVILVIDAERAFDKADLQLADHVLKEGRGLVIAVNKWDTVKNQDEMMEHIRYRMETSLAQARGVPIVTLSALSKRNVTKVIDKAIEAFGFWNKRVTTGPLNKWLMAATSKHIPPLSKGKRVKFRYMTQVKSRPPTFVMFTSSNTDELPDSYLRYLTHNLREAFEFGGSPIRLNLRKSENPFD